MITESELRIATNGVERRNKKATKPAMVTKAPASSGMPAKKIKAIKPITGMIGTAKNGTEVKVKTFFFFIISPLKAL